MIMMVMVMVMTPLMDRCVLFAYLRFLFAFEVIFEFSFESSFSITD